MILIPRAAGGEWDRSSSRGRHLLCQVRRKEFEKQSSLQGALKNSCPSGT